jgi:hypothetical protein
MHCIFFKPQAANVAFLLESLAPYGSCLLVNYRESHTLQQWLVAWHWGCPHQPHARNIVKQEATLMRWAPELPCSTTPPELDLWVVVAASILGLLAISIREQLQCTGCKRTGVRAHHPWSMLSSGTCLPLVDDNTWGLRRREEGLVLGGERPRGVRGMVGRPWGREGSIKATRSKVDRRGGGRSGGRGCRGVRWLLR